MEEDRKQSDEGRKASRWLASWLLKQRAPSVQAEAGETPGQTQRLRATDGRPANETYTAI